MENKLHCDSCGKDYWPKQGWMHAKCEKPVARENRTPESKPPKSSEGKPKFDRVAYQREYMREKRAKEKAAKLNELLKDAEAMK